jgi:hypothetical protein
MKLPTVVEERLEVLAQDKQSIVEKRFAAWTDVCGNIEEEFKGKLMAISSEQPMGMVTQNLNNHVM